MNGLPTPIAIIDDDPAIRDLLTALLAREGYECRAYADGRTGLEGLATLPPALVLLDIGLPGMDGMAVCRAIRSNPRIAGLPVVMLTGAFSEASQLLGFEVGADDYVTKPWAGGTLVARIRAVLRRTRPQPASAPLEVGPLSLDPEGRRASVEGRLIALTPTEFRILEILMERPGRAFRRVELLETQSDGREGADRNVDVHVTSIRKKLGAHHAILETVWGTGYRLAAPPPSAGGGAGG